MAPGSSATQDDIPTGTGPKIGIIGKVHEYNNEIEDWTLYEEKLDQYFEANGIKDEKTKIATLISSIGNQTYKTLRDLTFPDLPKTKTYVELTELLKTQFSPHISIWRERFKFYGAQQRAEESIMDWYVRIKSLATNCKFGNTLESVLTDKFVTGLVKSSIIDRLCEEPENKKLKELVKLAVQREAQGIQSSSSTSTEKRAIKRTSRITYGDCEDEGQGKIILMVAGIGQTG